MHKDKLVTATLTANYNNGKYFAECLNGILSQTIQPDIICVVDDGSTDNSYDLIWQAVDNAGGRWVSMQPKMDNSHYWMMQSAKLGKSRVYFFPNKENKGPAAARNTGLKFLLDKADIVCVADCDDILLPTKLEKSLNVMWKYPHVGLVYSDYITVSVDGKEAREYKEPFNYKRLTDECIVSNNSVYTTSIIKKVGLYDESLFGPEDYDMWLRISENAAVYHIPEALYKYRLTGQNITTTTPSEKFQKHVYRVKQKIAERQYANN